MRKTILLLLLATANTLNAQNLSFETLHSFDSRSYGALALVGFSNQLCFTANDGTSGYELWHLDSANTTTMVYDLYRGSGGSILPQSYNRMAVLNNKLYFSAIDGVSDYKLYVYDGNNPPTPAPGYPANPGAAIPIYVTAMGNRIYYSANTGNGNGLYRYDGINYPVLIDSNRTATSPNLISGFVPYNGKLYFTALTAALGTELYAYDPVTDSISLIEDINPGRATSNPASLTVANDRLYFSASTSNEGRELYVYDGVAVSRLTDLAAGTLSGVSSSQHAIGALDSMIYFSGSVDGSRKQLYRYDASNGTTTLVSVINTSGDSNPEGFTRYKNNLYFSASIPTTGNELWRTDGSNTTLVQDMEPGAANSNPAEFYVWGNRLYFCAYSDDWGYTLFRLNDPTAVEYIPFDGEVQLYPNPARNNTVLHVRLRQAQALRVNLTDMMGRIVWYKDVATYSSGHHDIDIQTASMVPGIYSYSLMDGRGGILAVGKIVRQ